jgi:hypothetical protein
MVSADSFMKLALKKDIRFEALTLVILMSAAFWVITPFNSERTRGKKVKLSLLTCREDP